MNAIGAPAANQHAPLIDSAALLAERVRSQTIDWAAFYGCSPRLAEQAKEQWAQWNPASLGTQAAFTFTGEAFGRLKPETWTAPNRAQERLRILSGLYGILRPQDGVLPYRLDLGQSLEGKRLTHYWKESVTDWLLHDAGKSAVLNCASEEYTEGIDSAKFWWIDLVFLQNVKGKIRSVSALSKQARGAMARFLANHSSSNPEAAQTFKDEGYGFFKEESNESRWVFVRK
jgi:cytoplasmic iron level regulating protein YaaA (DUF328/UPF0246 family)